MRAGPDEDVVADFERVEGHLASAHAHGRSDGAVCADDGASVVRLAGEEEMFSWFRSIPADCDGGRRDSLLAALSSIGGPFDFAL